MKDSSPKSLGCPICNSTYGSGQIPYIDSFNSSSKNIFKNLSIEFCKACGFGYSFPDLEDEAVSEYYTHVYRDRESPHFVSFLALSKPLFHNYRSLAQLVLARHFVDFEEGDTFVDIGPGRGESFMSASNVFKKPKMFAVELSDGASVAYKNIYGIETFQNIKKLSQHTNNIKVLLSSHSLEHFKLKELQPLFMDIKKALGLNGVFIAEVPNVDMRVHSQMRDGDTPHLLFFSKESLKKMIESFGFDVLFIDSCGTNYDVYWAKKNEKKRKIKKKLSLLKNILRAGFKKMPVSVKIAIKKIYNKIRPELINFGVNDFSYGGNRTCLRVVARPQKDLSELSKSE